MDSVTQFVLGAALAGAVMARRTSAGRALLWGGIAATLPDLDVLIEHGDPVRNMTMHRGESHSLLFVSMAAPLIAYGIVRLHRQREHLGAWCVAIWLSLFTHPLLDAMTIYGTRLLLPFTDRAFAVGSLFVIDPLYTLPLLVGCAMLWRCRDAARGRRWNLAGLVLSTVYAGWSLVAQQWVLQRAEQALREQRIDAVQMLATPAPFQTLLWRIVVLTDTGALEAFYSLLDGEAPIEFGRIEHEGELQRRVREVPAVSRLAAFSGGFVRTSRVGDEVRIADVRMGQEPYFVFTFVVAHIDADGSVHEAERPRQVSARLDSARGVAWLWRRMWGDVVPPPR